MPEPEAHTLAAQWLRYANEDLRNAELALREREMSVPRHAGFAAQQAAEKAIKAVLVAQQLSFPFVHDLRRLLDLLDDAEVVGATRDADGLSEWAVQPRYPGEDDAEWPEAEQAVADARAIVEAAGRDVEGLA